jgi:hypothetical protein
MQQYDLIGYVRQKDVIRVINPVESIQQFLKVYSESDELLIKIKGTNEIIFQSQEGIERLSKLNQYGINLMNRNETRRSEDASRFKVREAENSYYTIQYDELDHIEVPNKGDEFNLMSIVRKVGDIKILMKNHKLPICFKVKDSHQVLHSFNPLNYTVYNEKNEQMTLDPRLPLEYHGVQKEGIVFHILDDIIKK